MKTAHKDTEQAKQFAELVAWASTDEAAAEVKQAVEGASEDAQIFLRMDRIDPEVYFAPMTI